MPNHPRSVYSLASADGTLLYYKDWGMGPPIVFCHGWPLNARGPC